MYEVTKISPKIFRAYDIRGAVDDELTENNAYSIGLAIGSEVISTGGKKIISGRDGRLSGPRLLKALRQGLLDAGCDIIDVGMLPSPALYFSSHHLNIDCAVMLTGSHNPSNYNGMKIIINGTTLTQDAITALYQRIIKADFTSGNGSITQKNIIDDYIQAIIDKVSLKKPLKIVVDAGNGVGGFLVKPVFESLGCEVIELYCEVDGNFPNHHPDPTIVENLQDLINSVAKHQADVGIALDGDADRVGIVTNKGKIIWPDRLMALLAKDILATNPQAKVVFDVKCSKHLPEIIQEAGGIPIMAATGHSLIKAKMKAENALLAGEMSGHIFFNDRWFGFDDGIYSAARLLEIIAKHDISSDELFSLIPDSLNTPELKVFLPEEIKFSFMEKLTKHADFNNGKIITLDGLRVEFEHGWGLVRASNTTPCLTVRFEAETAEYLEEIKDIFRKNLLTLDENQQLQIPF